MRSFLNLVVGIDSELWSFSALSCRRRENQDYEVVGHGRGKIRKLMQLAAKQREVKGICEWAIERKQRQEICIDHTRNNIA